MGTYIIWVFIITSLCAITFLMTRAIYTGTITKLRESNSELMKEQASGVTVSPAQLAEYGRIVVEHTRLNEDQNKLVVYLRETFPGVGAGRYAGMDLAQMVKTIIREVREGK